MDLELVWAVPFVVLLGSIAIFPLVAKPWWEKNYPIVCAILALPVLAHYLFGLRNAQPLIHTGVEYFSFITLIGSLFTVAGGIHIQVKGEAKPWVNGAFLAVGAVLANLLGTTGASMVLIRPWIRMNKYRFTAHHLVFFIFIVSNIGGALTPIGDPPLFLGYLKGIPFFWVMENVWALWLLTLGILLTVFWVLDSRNYAKAPEKIREKETAHEEWKFSGLHNGFFLLVILAAVFVTDPPGLREALMALAAFLSYKTTPRVVHEQNDFNFAPIKEVALLFAGIFTTMIPALEWLERHAASLGITQPGQFFWGSGILSSVLDNAPTYLNFLSASIGLFVKPEMVEQVRHLIATHGGDIFRLADGHPEEIRQTFLVLQKYHATMVAQNRVPTDDIQVAVLLANHAGYIRAISVGSVFFGAMTYIGNGPNFLVKSIADQSRIKTPSFFGYLFRWSLPILVPVFGLVWFFFFRI